jgi:hypothetical protein
VPVETAYRDPSPLQVPPPLLVDTWDILNIPAFLQGRCSEVAEPSKEGVNVGD